MSGIFITFEGGEGSGKTTIAKMIKNKLESQGYQVVLTREPGGVDIAEQIRDVIVDVKNTKMDYRTEALLYAASRRQHLVEKIRPALSQDKIVICDRYIDSSLVYQGIGRGIGIQEVYDMNLFATDHLLPELTIFFDVKPEIGLRRVMEHDDREVNRLDLEKIEFHELVYHGYKTIQERYPERIKSVDASLSIDDVFNQVDHLIKDLL